MRSRGESNPSRRKSVFFVVLHLGAAVLVLLLLHESVTRHVGVLWGWQRSVVHIGLALSAAAFVMLAGLAGWQALGRNLTQRGTRARRLTRVILAFVLGVALVTSTLSPGLQHPPRPGPPPSIQHARWLAILLSERAHQKPWPAYGGKNFVLSLVAHKVIDVRNPDNLTIFFCPGSPGALPVPPRVAYEAVTEESLVERRFPVLTDFAGRRNDEPEYSLKPGDHERELPILGCRMEDGVIVGFSSGRVRWLGREALGLSPDDPVVFGDGARSPILRALSDL